MMDTLTKYLIAFLLALSAALGAWGWQGRNGTASALEQAGQYQRLHEDEKRAVAALVSEKILAEKALTNRAVYAERLLAKTTKEKNELKQALSANPEWAGTRVPDRLRTALEGS